MTRHRTWWSPLAVLTAAVLVFAACAGAPASPPTTGGTAAPTGAATGSPTGELMSYPTEGEVTCAQGDTPGSYAGAQYEGEFKRIRAQDANTVVFELCAPDVAFLPKIAFTSFAINDTAYLQAHVPDGSIVSSPNGTGPYRMAEWRRGDQIVLQAHDAYWGEKAKAPRAVFRWSKEAAQRLVELQSANVDGIDNVGPTDFDTVRNNPDLQLKERPALNVFYIGFNNRHRPFDNEKVRQAIAQGIDRERIVREFYPPGSEVASHFTPCSIPFGCEGQAWYGFDAAAARRMLAEAGFPNGFETQLHLRDVFRGYLPEPVSVAQEIQRQLRENLNIRATIDVQEETAYIDNADAGKLTGIHMLGWGADYPDPTNFLDFHFGTGASAQFGEKFPDITRALERGGSSIDEATRREAYREANDAVRTHVPMIPVAHGGSATAWRADVQGAHSSPLGNENLAVMTPGDRDQLVWMQNAEPGGLYCADESDGESLRVCEQVMEALYAYEVGGVETQPALAESCDPNQDLTVWTCRLRQGVTFHDGATLDANDVVLSYAVQWDLKHPLHKGRDNSFTYFSGLFGGFLNVEPPASPSPAVSPGASPAATPGGSPATSPAGTPASPGASPSPS